MDCVVGMNPLIERMTELEKVQLVRAAADPEPAYLFKHVLIQETVYQSLLKMARADLHRRVAEVIERLGAEQLDENAAVLELHYERAGLYDKAFHYAVRAGDQAAHAFAHVETLTFYDRALSLAAILEEQDREHDVTRQVGAVYVQRGRVYEVTGNHAAAVENYRAMIEFAKRISDAAMEADGLNHLVTAQVVLTGPTPETDEQLERAWSLGQRVGDPELVARAMWNKGLAYRLIDPQRAKDDFARALELVTAGNLRQLAGHVRMDLSLALVHLGHVREAQEYLQAALADFRALDLKPMISDALGTMAYHAYMRGEPAHARAFAEEGRSISRAIENPWGFLYNQMFCVFLLDLEGGHLDRVLEESEPFLKLASQPGYPYFAVMCYSILTQAYLQLSQPARAEAWAAKVTGEFGTDRESPLAMWARWLEATILVQRGELEQAHALLEPLMEGKRFPLGPLDFTGWLGQTLAELALGEKRWDEGLELCDRLLGEFEREEQMGFAAGMWYWRAEIHQARGDVQVALQDALRARELLERAEHRILLWRSEGLLARIYGAQGNDTESLNARARAGVFINYIAEHSPADLRESFVGSAEVRRVMGRGVV